MLSLSSRNFNDKCENVDDDSEEDSDDRDYDSEFSEDGDIQIIRI